MRVLGGAAVLLLLLLGGNGASWTVAFTQLHVNSRPRVLFSKNANQQRWVRSSLARFATVVIDQDNLIPDGSGSNMEQSRAIPGQQENGDTKTIRSCWRQLVSMTRPSNYPGIVLFHMLGTHLTLSQFGWSNQYFSILLKEPLMWLTLLMLMVTSASSMLVNDYFDAKLGRDLHKPNSALMQGRVTFRVVRRFVSALYCVALFGQAFLPSAFTRFTVMFGLVLTYLYTVHLKPITWVKNAACAGLIALSPLTSGSAALAILKRHHPVHVLQPTRGLLAALGRGMGQPLSRLVVSLFLGVAAREILMDCNDVMGDARVGVRTVPVVHGRRFAAFSALLLNAFMGISLVVHPAIQVVWTLRHSGLNGALVWSATTRRLVLASAASLLPLFRSWQVYATHGIDSRYIEQAVDEGLLTVLLLISSFV